jgi:hypothetical protein
MEQQGEKSSGSSDDQKKKKKAAAAAAAWWSCLSQRDWRDLKFLHLFSAAAGHAAIFCFVIHHHR